ncbi:MAG: leucine--tRNA ligase, partial [Candidatus Peregrinibacteria bacterium]|nr:leucine--tRNA ligase [Candidatus Peregrinibacteria bacterium]
MYESSKTEAKWQKKWEEEKVYEADLKKAKDPYYSMVMFPYPSGDKLHVGHWYNFAPADSFARYMRMQGKDVFTPMGFDAFGLPAENYAIKTGVHPDDSITSNVETMITQLKRIGCMYDWAKMVNTSKPEYYRWTQWLFLKMFENNLAYRKDAPVNWCNSCQTVLANEQCQDGTCERCGTEVEKKPMTQWYWKITDYAQKLLDNHEKLDWPEKTIAMQKNWIGRSEGVNINFPLEDGSETLVAYTTRPDTIYSVTFIVMAPEHPLVEKLTKGKDIEQSVKKVVQKIQKQTDIERTSEGGKDKLGAFLGVHAINPVNGEKIPVYVANFALMYGTGIVMADAHDQRDFEFAAKYDIPLKFVISEDGKETDPANAKEAYTDDGILFNSGEFSGMRNREALPKIADWMEKKKMGKRQINYKLRDWSISRQRYWGAPIPIVYDLEGNPHPIPEEHLPWELPRDVEFKPTGTAPLAQSKELKERTEKIFGKGWTPEVDTMDTFVCSSFYQFRYLAEGSDNEFVPKDIDKKWMPVDMYIGGPEHACMHLIYARFVTMALKEWGYASNDEPFQRLVHQGLITNNGAKMSKSKGNVVSPDAFVEQYGSDVFRMYLMFMGPFEGGGDWSDTGIKGIDRFVQRVWRLFGEEAKEAKDSKEAKEVQAKLHQTIRKVTADIEALQFNTAIAALMELLNLLEKQEGISKETAKIFTTLLSPMAPHLAQELWESVGEDGFIINSAWPIYDEALCKEETVTVAIQVNGKVRGEISVAADAAQEEVIALAKQEPNVAKYLEGA